MIFDIQKASVLKRISALLLDAILLVILAVGFAWPISAICKYEKYTTLSEKYNKEYADYKETYEQQLIDSFGGDFYKALEKLVESDYETLSEENKKAYDDYDALTPAEEVDRVVKLVYNIMLLMTSLGLFLAYLVLEFIIPLFLKNGQTVGKKVFNLGLVRPDCVKINNIALFARAILGKYTIETMIPVFSYYLIIFGNVGILGLIVIAIVLLTNLGMFIFSKDHTTIHDLVAGTVVVDLSTQMVFNSEEELIKKKEEIHAEKAVTKEY